MVYSASKIYGSQRVRGLINVHLRHAIVLTNTDYLSTVGAPIVTDQGQGLGQLSIIMRAPDTARGVFQKPIVESIFGHTQGASTMEPEQSEETPDKEEKSTTVLLMVVATLITNRLACCLPTTPECLDQQNTVELHVSEHWLSGQVWPFRHIFREFYKNNLP